MPNGSLSNLSRDMTLIRTPAAQWNSHVLSAILRYTGGDDTYDNPPFIDDRPAVRVELEVCSTLHATLAVCEGRVKLALELLHEHVRLYQWLTPGTTGLFGCSKCGGVIRAYYEITDHDSGHYWRDPCCTSCLMNF